MAHLELRACSLQDNGAGSCSHSPGGKRWYFPCFTLFLAALSERDRFLDVWAVLSSFCLQKQTVCPLGTSRSPLKPRDHPGLFTYTPCQICPT